MLKMAWDLLLASWLWVAAVIRLAMPSSSRSMACLQSVTTCWDKSDGKQRILLNTNTCTAYNMEFRRRICIYTYASPS